MTTNADGRGASDLCDQLGPLPPHRHSLNSGTFAPLYTADQMRAYAAQSVAAERERWQEAGWVCADGFPALLGHKPLKPGAKLYALPDDWA